MGELEENEISKNQDPLTSYVVHLFEDLILCDTKIDKIVSTMRNFRRGIDGASK